MIKVQKIFTKIRNIINEKEDKLLLEINQKFEENYFNEDFLKEYEKIPQIIKISLEKGKKIENEWDNNYKLNKLINDCIDIEKNISCVNNIKESLNKYKKNIAIKFIPEEECRMNKFLESINNFGKIIIDDEDVFNISHIIDFNKDYSRALKQWIDKEDIKVTLLYRLSRDGSETSKFIKYVIIVAIL